MSSKLDLYMAKFSALPNTKDLIDIHPLLNDVEICGIVLYESSRT